MIRKTHIFKSSLLALLALTAGLVHAEEKAPADEAQPTLSENEIAESLKKLVFVPHDTGAPEVTDAGGVRAVTVLPKIELLAPDKMARTLSPTPTLYWHISKGTEAPLRFTLLADDVNVIDPLLEFQIDGIDQEGIYGVNLDDHGLSLEDGQRYIWSIALSSEGDSYGNDLVAQTVMEHKAGATLSSALETASPEDRAVRLAAEGYWYDTIDTLSDQIEAGDASPWQSARAQLLDQAGLLQSARYDRQRVGSDADLR
ncbi:MAG: DUF928 domain-containing protein [Pseudomonadota bacterium]